MKGFAPLPIPSFRLPRKRAEKRKVSLLFSCDPICGKPKRYAVQTVVVFGKIGPNFTDTCHPFARPIRVGGKRRAGNPKILKKTSVSYWWGLDRVLARFGVPLEKLLIFVTAKRSVFRRDQIKP